MEDYREYLKLALDLRPEITSFDDIVDVMKTIIPYRRLERYGFGVAFSVSKKILEQFEEPITIGSKFMIYAGQDAVIFENTKLKNISKWQNRYNEIVNTLISKTNAWENKYNTADSFNDFLKDNINMMYGRKVYDFEKAWIIDTKDED